MLVIKSKMMATMAMLILVLRMVLGSFFLVTVALLLMLLQLNSSKSVFTLPLSIFKVIIDLTLGISAFTPLIIVLTASKVTRVIPIRGTWEADINKFSKKRLLILLRHHGRHL